MKTVARGRMAKGALLIVVLLALAAPGITYWQSKVARIQFDDVALSVGGGFYHVEVPYEVIAYDEITVGPTPESSLSIRTNGIGWPGFGLGWFRNKSGDRVFAFVRSGQLIYIPTRLDFHLVVSVDDEKEFLDELSVRTNLKGRGAEPAGPT